MRRSVQPNCPRAMTCCFFVSLKMLAMPAKGPRSLPPRQRLERLLSMAGFQMSTYGRALSAGRCNSAAEHLGGFHPSQRLSRASVELPGRRGEIGECVGAEVHASREVLTN